jgi:NADPH:quinone reductase-like Zn-dependent oxidoreductase
VRWAALSSVPHLPVPRFRITSPRVFSLGIDKVFDFTGNRHLGLAGDDEALERAKAFIAAGLADGSFPITIDREFQGLESLPDAMRYMASNQAAGKIIVTL